MVLFKIERLSYRMTNAYLAMGQTPYVCPPVRGADAVGPTSRSQTQMERWPSKAPIPAVSLAASTTVGRSSRVPSPHLTQCLTGSRCSVNVEPGISKVIFDTCEEKLNETVQATKLCNW